MGKIELHNLHEDFITELDELESKALNSPYTIGNVSGLEIESYHDTIILKWSDPSDILVTAKDGTKIPLAEWGGTKVVYNTTHYPTSVDDGVLIEDNIERDKYKENGLVFKGHKELTYYIALFPYTKSGIYTIDTVNRIEVTLVFDKLEKPVINSVQFDGDGIKVKWTDPEDTVRTINNENVKTATWSKSVLVRKEGSEPENIEDGVLIVESVNRNEYKEEPFNDKTYLFNKTYYYKVFAIDDNGKIIGSESVGVVSYHDDRENVPGPSTLLGGNTSAGFFGEVPSSEFITGDALASMIGLTAGISQYSDTPWLKFILDGKILFTPKKPIRYNLTWNDINDVNAVYGDRTVNIKGQTYKIRLWRGASTDPSKNNNTDRSAIGSEWNRLMLPIHVDAPDQWKIDGTLDTKFGGTTEDWGINYTDADLLTHSSYGNGSYTWCQERAESTSFSRVIRCGIGVSNSNWYSASVPNTSLGWRPVLELEDDAPKIPETPGSNTLIAGSTSAGFFGEVPSSEFITGDSLASMIGLTAGVSQYSDTTWLKFILDGKILYTPKKPIRHSISWDNINAVNAVYGNRTVTIKGQTYKIRLWKGALTDPSKNNNSDRGAIGSEWNRLMLPIHADAPDQWKIDGTLNTTYGGTTEDWGINYTDADLLTHVNYVNGSATLCQETIESNSSYRVFRGDFGVSNSNWTSASTLNTYCGWRPVLEIVTDNTNPSYESTHDSIFLKWTDPNEIITEPSGTSTNISQWKGTKVVYRTDRYPTSPDDGTILIDNTTKNQYKNNGFQFTGIDRNTTYYIAFFPYTDNYKYSIFNPAKLEAKATIDRLSPISDLTLTISGSSVVIQWSDPEDVIRNVNGQDITTTRWVKSTLVRKENSEPTGVNDGVKLVEYSDVKSKYSTNGFVDNNVDGGKKYYYKVFVEDNLGVVYDESDNCKNIEMPIGTGIPGPSTLIAGSTLAGFFGEVPSSEFITGDELASMIGLTAGTSQYSDTPWLKFILDGNILFTPKKPIRYNLTWDNINAVNAVYGNRTVIINGLTYKVRLWRGALTDPSKDTDPDRGAIGSEWNRLMLPIHVDAPDQWKISGTLDTRFGGTTEDWGINYTDADLLTHYNHGNGSATWCQETTKSNSSNRVIRGYTGMSNSYWFSASNLNNSRGWRPVLELVQA